MIVLVAILIITIIFFINNRISIVKLEKEQMKLDSISKQIRLNEAIYQKRIKEFEEHSENKRKQVELLKEDIEKELRKTVKK